MKEIPKAKATTDAKQERDVPEQAVRRTADTAAATEADGAAPPARQGVEEPLEPIRKRRSPSTEYTPSQKCEAVLRVWTERRSAGAVCRELGIGWTILNQWQERAMEGMLQALEPRVRLEEGPCLSPRLQALLRRKREEPSERLARRLDGVARRGRPRKAEASEPE